MTQFDFYLINKSFECPSSLNTDDLSDRIAHMASDIEFIREQNEKVYKHSSIYEVEFIENDQLIDVLYDPEYDKLDRPTHLNLLLIIDQASQLTNIENEEVIELLEDHDEENVSGLLCLYGIDDVDQKYCVYTKNDWFTFHRYFLTVYVPSTKDFCREVSPYFPNIYFNTNSVISSMRSLHVKHEEIITTIIHHLTAINDVFYEYFQKDGASGDSACDDLENHYRGHEVKIGASRDKNNCDDLDFMIRDEWGNTHNLYCDLHTKFYQYFEYKNPSYTAKGNRIYFHQPVNGFLNDKVILVHIGEHLCN